MTITLFERKSKKCFSIEKLSENILHFLSDKTQIKKHVFAYRSTGLFNRIKIILEANRNASEVNHITGDTHFASFFLKRKNTIITMHDCEKLIGNDYSWIKKRIYKLFWFTLPNMKCKWIVAPSEDSKKNLARYAGIPTKKIFVILNGIDSEFRILKLTKAEKNKLLDNPLNKKCILHVSGNSAHKNTFRLILALEGINAKFVKVGKLSSHEKNLLENKQIDYIHFENISKEKLVQIYNSADCLVYPSIREGFGLPIIEAQGCGCPVITSNCSSMREVAGKGAILVNPYSVEDINNAIRRLLKSSDIKHGLVKNGLENIKGFKWENTAQQYNELYQKILCFSRANSTCNCDIVGHKDNTFSRV